MSTGQESLAPSLSMSYISASANRFSRAAHSSNSSLVAFGSSTFVALWNADGDEDTGVFQTLPEHKGQVTCVRFKNEKCFFSADDKGYLICWKQIGNKAWWCSGLILQAHSKAISALEVFENCIATGSSDAKIKVWHHKFSEKPREDTLAGRQELDLKGRYPLDIHIATLPESNTLIMAASATETNLTIFIRSDEQFVRALSLPGHEDWVKCLAFQTGIAGSTVLTLASGSQDSTIRLWNIEQISKSGTTKKEQYDGLDDELLNSFEAALGDIAEGEEGGRQISTKRHIITTRTADGSTTQYSVTFDALLIGHEAGVTTLSWRPSRSVPVANHMLLSTSTDSSLILWAPSSITGSAGGESTSIWINQQRFGDIGGQRLGGFVGGLWARDGSDALAWGWGGGWRRWRSSSDPDQPTHEAWNEINAIGGHKGPVRGVSWSPGGEYLISVGPDQTTRIHANTSPKGDQGSWHEICRPQVHGYDLVDAVFLYATRFVSIADEKVARVFDAPRSLLSLCKHLKILPESLDEAHRPIAASVPPLGLSNKALSTSESTEAHFPMPSSSMSLRRPFEGEFSISTLWPEVEKVFGHGYELHAIAASHSGRYVATACKASTAEHAGIIVYDAQSWRPFGQTLVGHQLTVTRIVFSPDDRYILSVSRDRSWRVYQVDEEGYIALAADKSHARIIWDCTWADEGDIFATASRDKTVKIWRSASLSALKQTPLATLKLNEAATAVTFGPQIENGQRMLAIGLENGEILIYAGLATDTKSWRKILVLDRTVAHVEHVHRVAWRPRSPQTDHLPGYELATCSEDGTLRVIRIGS